MDKRNAPGRKPGSRKQGWLARTYHKHRKLKIALTVLLLLVLVCVIAVFAGAGSLLGKINTNADETEYSGMPSLEADPQIGSIEDDPQADSLRGLVREWATNGGEKYYTPNVLNYLLIGTDSRTDAGTDGGALSDSMILVSINKKTQTISLASIYRDCFTYASVYDGSYGKLTEIHNWGGPRVLIETIENNFKIRIDGYASVNFVTFPKIINAIGGVEIDITQREADWLTNHEGVSVAAGRQTLNGEQALAYSRIRYLDADGDVSRTQRQRNVITALIQKGRSASLSEVRRMLDLVLPNISTSLSSGEILSLATKALTSGWNKYQVRSFDIPAEEARTTARISGKDYWVVDYPLAAQQLQTALYGQTNIVLREGRVTALELAADMQTGSAGS